MNNLFSYDDLGTLTESLGRVPDDAILSRLVETAREAAAKVHAHAVSRYPSQIEAYRNQLEEYQRHFEVWSAAKAEFDRQSRRYDGAMRVWQSGANEDTPRPTPPVDPGPMPEAPEPPPEPVPPTDQDAIALLMAEQRAAVERMQHEHRSEPDNNIEIERAEIVNEAFDLVMRKLGRTPPAPEPEHKFPASLDEKLSDYAPVEEALSTDDLLASARENPMAAEQTVQRLDRLKRKKFFELLNVELAELQQERGGPREDLKRESEIESLLGLFARVGEM